MFKCEINHQSGFTLIELVVVILLLGILSVVAMGRMFDGNQFAARGFFDDTVTAVRFAQKLAVSTGCEVQVRLLGTGYELNQPADRANCRTGVFATPVRNPANRSNPYVNNEVAGLTLAPTPTTIVFDAQGLAANDAVIVMTGTDTYQFSVSSATGLVSVP
jgi:MSHA pilin protein MshC